MVYVELLSYPRRYFNIVLEVFEKEDKYVVRAELPGMKEEDIDVSIVSDTLAIKGERKAESEVKKETITAVSVPMVVFSVQ